MGCRRVTSPDRLVRVVARPGGGLAVGRTEPGRGAWLCDGSPACFEAAARRKAFDRALRTTVRKEAVDELGTMLSRRGRIDGWESAESRQSMESAESRQSMQSAESRQEMQ